MKEKGNVVNSVESLRERINEALKGDNIGQEIQDAVWDMLRDLEVYVPGSD